MNEIGKYLGDENESLDHWKEVAQGVLDRKENFSVLEMALFQKWYAADMWERGAQSVIPVLRAELGKIGTDSPAYMGALALVATSEEFVALLADRRQRLFTLYNEVKAMRPGAIV